MSKSIYGVRMPGTMGDVINQLHTLRPLMARRANQLIARAVAKSATDHHDRNFLFNADQPQNFLSTAYGEVRQRIIDMEKSGGRDPEVDANFEVVICEDGNNAVLLSFTEHYEWFSDLLDLPGAEDFSYWDGTDRPDTVSEEEWSTRRRTYERILSRDPYGRPAGCGVTLSFQKPIEPPSIDAILSEVPAKEVRANRMARQVLLSEWAQDQGPGKIEMTDFMAFATSLSRPEMAEEVSKHAREIAEKLPDLDDGILKGSRPHIVSGNEEDPSPDE
jgi:hypothetical protein